jgi:hypothetical protein
MLKTHVTRTKMTGHQGAWPYIQRQPAKAAIELRHQFGTKPASLIRPTGEPGEHVQRIAEHIIFVGTVQKPARHACHHPALALGEVRAVPATHRHGPRVVPDFSVQWNKRNTRNRVSQSHIRRLTKRSGFQHQRFRLAGQVEHHANVTPGAAGEHPYYITGKTTAGEQQQVTGAQCINRIVRLNVWLGHSRPSVVMTSGRSIPPAR